MLKKIALAAALTATASFATWDYFPIQDAGRGTVEAGLYYDWDGDWSQAGLKLGGRYTVIPQLELSLQSWGYQLWSEVDCDNCPDGGDGLRDLTIGARYQVDPQLSGFVDLRLPIGGDEVSNDEVAIYAGAQFATLLTPEFMLGGEAGFDWGFEHDDYERGLELHVGVELDYSLIQYGVTPLIGLQFKYRITDNEYDGPGAHWENGSGDTQINIWLGANYALNQQIYVTGKLIVRSGDMDGDATGLYAGCGFNF